eukprot:6183771-Pleurochrysis_carterae.AAC.5
MPSRPSFSCPSRSQPRGRRHAVPLAAVAYFRAAAAILLTQKRHAARPRRTPARRRASRRPRSAALLARPTHVRFVQPTEKGDVSDTMYSDISFEVPFHILVLTLRRLATRRPAAEARSIRQLRPEAPQQIGMVTAPVSTPSIAPLRSRTAEPTPI